MPKLMRLTSSTVRPSEHFETSNRGFDFNNSKTDRDGGVNGLPCFERGVTRNGLLLVYRFGYSGIEPFRLRS
jgi:hypothetical protein